MKQNDFDQLLARWAGRTRLTDMEAAATLTQVDYPGPLPAVHEACIGPWVSFWECIDRMLRCVSRIGPHVERRCCRLAG